MAPGIRERSPLTLPLPALRGEGTRVHGSQVPLPALRGEGTRVHGSQVLALLVLAAVCGCGDDDGTGFTFTDAGGDMLVVPTPPVPPPPTPTPPPPDGGPIPPAPPCSEPLDVVFVLDVSTSMADEVGAIRNGLRSIWDAAHALTSNT
ncbi:MAG: hypothetical protein IT379_17295, partial [Deltaproteobacteria bacterium]|nr:hypothetical protein [Deltaproteobacteria bacterium]